jgi:hypothetical protein
MEISLSLFVWGKEEEFDSIDGLSAVNAISNISNHTLVGWFNWEFCFFLSSDTITTVTCKKLGNQLNEISSNLLQ